MNCEYWNNLAPQYEDEIFSVLQNDRNELVVEQIRRFGSPDKTACDFGCGTGQFLPYLSESFQKVFAVDISRDLLATAKKKCARLSNVSYMTADLASRGLRLSKTPFGLSVNMLIMPSLAWRLRILDALAGHILKDGHLVLVVPSLESAMLADFRLVEMNLHNGFRPAYAERAGFETTNHRRLRQGIIPIDNVPTKHYLKEELVALLRPRGLRIDEILKIEYPWDTEFDSPPCWMKEPLPWDWLVVSQKRR
ncbi:MAG: class I SAM-dependent methyltransferase [Sedimentisphaerales bacterium]|nr:class I SAM-dependent methyltransferase [Sedimentisphaerales bacterium]